MTIEATTVEAPMFKLVTVWAAVGITSWADVAAFLASLYSFLLIAEWCWKTYKLRRSRDDASRRRKDDPL